MKKHRRESGISTPRIAKATTPAEIGRVHEVMRELRPHHPDRKAFIRQVQRQIREGFRLAYLECDGEVRAVAGYRIYELLFSGRTLYVDDLVTCESDRSRGFGGQLFDWLVAEGRRENCRALTLDSGVQRFDAHRFYLLKRMKIASHHFTMALSG
ncbi:MAG TPA: GNAT family N-acetyltransferase [Chthoniobacterales bacterium]|nr:GNAT family N-acetyltransferase [Chthoniobacterales bacterium]